MKRKLIKKSFAKKYSFAPPQKNYDIQMMKAKKYIIIIFLLTVTVLFLNACSSKNRNDGTYFYDFDELVPFVNDPSISNSSAHSRIFSVKIDEYIPYGVAFKAKFNTLKKSTVSKVRITAWVKVDDMRAMGNIVCAVDENDKTVLWNAIDLRTFIKNPKEWTEVSGDFDLSKWNKPDNMLVIYPMFKGKGTIWVDDMEITCK